MIHSSPNPLLSVENLTIAFEGTEVVRDVSFTVNRGEIVAIVGESGSGKSLTTQAILKLLPGNAVVTGQTLVEGTDTQPLSERAITRIRGDQVGMIFQEPMTALNPLHPIARQMTEAFCVHHTLQQKSPQAQQKLRELLDHVGLSHLAERGTLYPHQLSGGERQRVMIASAIANDPDLLIADEPTTALDVTLQRQILLLLKQLQQSRSMGMVFITHDLLTVRAIADRVIVMRAGEIVEQGAVDAIFTNPQHAYTKMLLAAAPSGTAAPLPVDAKEILKTHEVCVDFPVKSPILRRTLRVVRAVENVSFTLREGETLGVVGESGSGKSSLGYALLRLAPSTGRIVFLGRDISAMNRRAMRPLRRHAQFVFQDPYSSLNPRMTVGEIILEGLRLHGTGESRVTLTPSPFRGEGGDPRSGEGEGGLSSILSTPSPNPLPQRERALAHRLPEINPLDSSHSTLDSLLDAILLQVGLTPDMKHRYPHAFSGGQRQRIAIARAMILKPQLVVLDEPTSALDMSVQHQVLTLLRDLQQSHRVSYLFISHDLRTVRAMAHQILVLKRGKVIEQGPCEQIFAAPQHEYTRTLLTAAFSETL